MRPQLTLTVFLFCLIVTPSLGYQKSIKTLQRRSDQPGPGATPTLQKIWRINRQLSDKGLSEDAKKILQDERRILYNHVQDYPEQSRETRKAYHDQQRAIEKARAKGQASTMRNVGGWKAPDGQQ